MSDHLKNVLLIGAGNMAVQYAQVLQAQNVSFTCVGRSTRSAKAFKEQTGCSAHTGGIDVYLKHNPTPPRAAIVAVNVEHLAPVTLALLRHGVKHILIEKPGGLHTQEIGQVAQEAQKQKARVYVAYNRRFYLSALKARKLIAEDGGVQSFQFEFTELSHKIASAPYDPQVKENWLLANSTHVIDMAFYLGGEPQSISTYTAGSLYWHSSAAVFSGSGITEKGALFSYHADWRAPGRWGIELMTSRRRFILRPLEELYMQHSGSFTVAKVPLQGDGDERFKPGLYRMVRSFLNSDDHEGLLSIEDQYRKSLRIYQVMQHPSTQCSEKL